MNRKTSLMVSCTGVVVSLMVLSGCGPLSHTMMEPPSPSPSPVQTGNGTNAFSHKGDDTASPTATPREESATRDDTLPKDAKPSYWYYDNLNSTDKNAYDAILKGVRDRADTIELHDVSTESLSRVFNIVNTEHPELFYLEPDYSYKYSKDENTGKDTVKSVNPKYSMSESEYDAKMDKIDDVVDPLLDKIRNMSVDSQYEAELLAHDWIIRHVDYYNNPILTGKQSFQTMYGAFVEGKANCMGYAAAMQYLMQRLGMESTIIIGDSGTDGSTEPHEWNMVKVNGDWYHVDVCWDDPTYTGNDDSKDSLMDVVHHGYFNVSSEMIGSTHNLHQNEQHLGAVPSAVSMKANYYNHDDKMVDSGKEFKGMVVSGLDKGLGDDGRVIDVMASDDAVYRSITGDMGGILNEAIKESGYRGSVRYVYSCSDDTRTILVRLLQGD